LYVTFMGIFRYFFIFNSQYKNWKFENRFFTCAQLGYSKHCLYVTFMGIFRYFFIFNSQHKNWKFENRFFTCAQLGYSKHCGRKTNERDG